jgi:hypothetical protein
LVATEIAERGIDSSGNAEAGEELWLRHPRVYPISYPWEWTAAQWRSAAELTLRIAGHAIDAGWILKDATPLNVLFAGARPVMVDVLSLERRDPRSCVWLAYGQFVRTFLLPLLAERFVHWPLQSTLFARDGYEPRAIYDALLPWQRLNPTLLDVVTLATLLEGTNKKSSGMGRRNALSTTDPELATHILHQRLGRLSKQVARASGAEKRSQWSDYQQSAIHYGAADVAAKQEFVRTVLKQRRPAQVLDIGANTGTYSIIAAESGASVVALDSDVAAINELWRTAAKTGLRITPLVANIARPTPAVGWRNREQLSLLERLNGNSDMVLMLAVIHHLILQEQIPLPHIADLCAGLTRRWLLLEWVPPSDPMFQQWLRGRDNLYGQLSEEDLRQAFAPFFHVLDRSALGNDRVLLLFERNTADRSTLRASPA